MDAIDEEDAKRLKTRLTTIVKTFLQRAIFNTKIRAYMSGKAKNINLTGIYHISSSFEKMAKKFGNAEKKRTLKVNIEKP